MRRVARASIGGKGWTVLGVYGLSHAAVDATCATILLAAVTTGRVPATQALIAFLLYNLLAFALQPGFGLLADGWHAERPTAALGAMMTAFALPLSLAPGMTLAGVVMAGLGNAIFHAGGGAVSLRLAPGSATAPGVFVAPGAAGLAAGTLLGKAGGPLWVPAAILAALAIAMAALPLTWPATGPEPASARVGAPARPEPTGFGVEVAVLFVLLVVAMRSFTGFAIALPWKTQLPLLAALTAAIVLGKAAGGVLADRFGHARVGVGALAFCAPLLMLATWSPVAGVLGMFVFNMTMPVTLVAVAKAVPDNPGFAFGAASLAIVIGALPALAGWSLRLLGLLPIAGAVWGSAAVLGVALYWLAHGRLFARATSPTMTEVAE